MAGKLEQIAAEIGVSKNTVLRVLRGENKEVWPAAIRRAGEIREMAAQLGYLPNGSARAVRRGTFNAVSLVLSSSEGRSYLPSDLFNEIHDVLGEQGTRLVVAKLADEKLTDRNVVPSILRDWSCDGLLINYTDHIPHEMIDLIGQYQVPSIWINSRQKADCVYYDEFGGGMEATSHLIAMGHRRIEYLDFVQLDQNSHYSRVDRYEGYVQAMRAAGLTPTDRLRFAGVPVTERLAFTLDLLRSNARPTAILSYDAGDRLLYAAALAGLQVPRDLSIMSFGPKPPPSRSFSRGEMFMGRDVALMRTPAEIAGRRAVEHLRQKIKGPSKPLPAVVVAMELCPGDTCAPPAEA